MKLEFYKHLAPSGAKSENLSAHQAAEPSAITYSKPVNVKNNAATI